MAIKLPSFPKPSTPWDKDYSYGVVVIRCKECRKKFTSYGTALCSNCTKEK